MKSFMYNPYRGLKGLPHDMWALFVTTLINRSGTMVIPFLTLYLTKKIGFTPSEAGGVLLVYGVAAFISAPVSGKMSDKLGSLKMMKLSLFGTGAMFVIFPFAQSYWLILLFAFVLSVINEAFRPANLSMITEIVTPPQRRMAFVLNRLAINAGMSIGPVIGGFLTLINYEFLFYVNAATSAAAGIYLNAVKWNSLKEKTSAETAVTGHRLNKSVLTDKKYILFLIGIIPLNLVFFQMLGALPLYIVDDLGYTTAAYGLFAAINTVLIIIAEVPLNDSMARIPYGKSLFIGAMFTALGFGATAFAASTFPLIIVFILWTIGEMIFFPVSAAYASEAAPVKQRGEYMGYYQMTFSFAFSAGPWLGTVVYQNYGAFPLWISTFFFGMITAVIMLFLKKPDNQGIPETAGSENY